LDINNVCLLYRDTRSRIPIVCWLCHTA
jgi:hypothetical protein